MKVALYNSAIESKKQELQKLTEELVQEQKNLDLIKDQVRLQRDAKNIASSQEQALLLNAQSLQVWIQSLDKQKDMLNSNIQQFLNKRKKDLEEVEKQIEEKESINNDIKDDKSEISKLHTKKREIKSQIDTFVEKLSILTNDKIALDTYLAEENKKLAKREKTNENKEIALKEEKARLNTENKRLIKKEKLLTNMEKDLFSKK